MDEQSAVLLKIAKEMAYNAGYVQAKIDAMNAIGEAIAVVANTRASDRDARISAMVHIRALVRGTLEKKTGHL